MEKKEFTEPTNPQELADCIDQSEWDFRTYSGGKWQVYAWGLVHVVDAETMEEAERLCNLHNDALKRRGDADKLEQLVKVVRWHVAYKLGCHQHIVAPDESTKNACLSISEDFRCLIDYCNSVLDDKITDPTKILEKGLPL